VKVLDTLALAENSGRNVENIAGVWVLFDLEEERVV
jgi:hypothetical protein